MPGPDVIVGDIEDVDHMGSNATQVGLAIGTDSCNNGDQPIDWFALPQTDHPVVPQNLYRMSGGADNDEHFEQIGQSWMKHTFLALEDTVCGNCDTSNCQQARIYARDAPIRTSQALMATKIASVRAPGSILSPDLSLRTPTITAATTTTAYPPDPG